MKIMEHKFIQDALQVLKKHQKKWIISAVIVVIAILLPLFWPVLNGYVTGTSDPLPAESSQEQQAEAEPLVVDCDYFIKNGTIVDGSENAPYHGSVAIKRDSIVAVSVEGTIAPSEGAQVIDAGGMIVAPGFIDPHTHTDDYWRTNPDGAPVLCQGVTTQIVGLCGTSTGDVAQYLQEVDHCAINVGTFIGYKALRREFVSDSGKVTDEVLAKMQEKLKQSLVDGAVGLSMGLSYFPQNKATYKELLALFQTVAPTGKLVAVHIRDEYDKVIPSVKELIELTKESGAKVEYSHIKAAGEHNWDKQDEVLALFDEAVTQDLNIGGDAYGYTYSSWDVAGTSESLSEANVEKVLKDPHVMVCSDSGLTSLGHAVHPRAYANYPFILIQYVRDKQVLTIEECIKKMTSMPALSIGIPERGLLKAGYYADIVIFNLQDLKVNATRTNPNQLSLGMSYVFVNGAMEIERGALTGAKGGVVIK